MSGQESAAKGGVYSGSARPREENVDFGGQAGYVGPIPDGADMDRATLTLRTSVDAPLAIERLSRDVYQEPKSAARENMANEIRSAALAASLHGAAPIIRVEADEETRQFSVQGIDTMGCTWDEFTKALAVIGRTTNADPRLPGQMGMGFYSNLLLSDTILLDSHSRETGERFTAMCKGGTEWQTGLKSAPMPKYGVRVSMTVHARIDMDGIQKKVRECALFSPCPVYLREESGQWEELQRFSSARALARSVLYDDMRPKGSRYDEAEGRYVSQEAPPPLPSPFVAAMRHQKYDGVLYMHGEKDGVEVCAAFVTNIEGERVDGRTVRKRKILEDDRHVCAYLAGMPIRLDYYTRDSAFRRALVLTVRVHDERLYRPTADRERFEADAQSRVCKKIDEILFEQLAAVRWPGTLAEHLRGPYRAAMDAAMDSGVNMGTYNRDIAVPTVEAGACAIGMLGRTPVRNGLDRRSMPLYHAAQAYPRAVLAKTSNPRLILAVARHDPSMRVIVTGKAGELGDSGFERIEAYMERAGIGPLNDAEFDEYARSAEWEAVRTSYGQHNADDARIVGSERQVLYMALGEQLKGTAVLARERGRIRAKDDDEIVAGGSHIGALVGAMLVSDTSITVARLAGRDGGGRKLGVDVLTTDPPAPPTDPPNAKIYAEADLLAKAAAHEFHTSSGTMTGDEIARHNGRIAILQCADSIADRLARAVSESKWFGRPGTLYVACGGMGHFVLVSLLGSRLGSGRRSRSGAEAQGGPGATPPAGGIFRVLALPSIPKSEERKVMVPAGSPITLADEIGECGDLGRASIVCDAQCDWETRMDLLLAALEVESEAVLRTIASSARAIEWEGTLTIRAILDDILDVDRAVCGHDSGRAEPRTGHVVDIPNGAIMADDKLLARAEMWLTVGGDYRLQALRRATVSEVGERAMHTLYHTNNGAVPGCDIVDAAIQAGGGSDRRRLAADIVVYGMDAPGLARALPARDGRTVAVVGTADDAMELACAVAAAGLKCRISSDGDSDVGSAMNRLDCNEAIGDVPGLNGIPYSWKEYPAIWHGMLAIENPGLKNMLAATLGNYILGRGDAPAIGAIVERFLWLDGQGWTRPHAGCDGGDGGDIAAAPIAPGTAAGDGTAGVPAAPRKEDSEEPGRGPGATKKR